MSNRTIITTLCLISILGGGSIGLVWLRMEISAVAKECRDLEDELEIVAREVHELRAQCSRAMRPSSLASMVQGRLSMPSSRLTFHISEEDMKRKLGTKIELAPYRRFKSAGEFAGTR